MKRKRASGLIMQVRFLRGDPKGEPCLRHQPLLATSMLAQLVGKIDWQPVVTMDLLNVLQRYMVACATCERIARTPIPLPYSRCASCCPCSACPQQPVANGHGLRHADMHQELAPAARAVDSLPVRSPH